jgi:phosphoenolpyruvate-protein phosphotransferase
VKRLQGVAAAPGIVRGPWLRIEPAATPVGGRISPGAEAGEIARMHASAATAATNLEAIGRRVAADGHPDEAAIFDAQAAIARDPALLALATSRVESSGDDAIGAMLGAADAFAAQLRSLDDERLAGRAADVVDVGVRIARLLAGTEESAVALDRPAIAVAGDLPPSLTATLPRDLLLGIALEGSSPTAHAAILARAYGIPAVVGVRDLIGALGSAREVALDGGTGAVVIDPDAATARSLDAEIQRQQLRHAGDLREAGNPTATSDGTAVALLANIGTPDESLPARALGARGVGLFRTEFLFLERTAPPSEDEQVAAYRQVLDAFAPHPVTIRLLDVGGDKPIPYLPIAHEANPFLGVRALRLAHAQPNLFVTQLRACYRAAAAPGVGPVKLMAPMIADATDVDLFLSLAERARTELAAEGQEIGAVELGVMLEIPSAILVADTYFDRISFASLGTNDLLQYALAVDRGNADLERYRDPLHPALLRLIGEAVAAAGRAGIDLSICGEMAGDPVAALALTGLGLRSLSMAAPGIPEVRRALRGASLASLTAAAGAALADRTAADARARFAAVDARKAVA